MQFDYLGAVDAHAQHSPDVVAFRNSRNESITYAELKRQSDALACWIAGNAAIPAHVPIVVYGHKSPQMLVCFFACAKSGHAYVPIDVMYPRERVATETKIMRDSDATVRAAIGRELARGGQVYYLYNRVVTITQAERRLRALCPEAKIDVAHGQMPTSMLAEKMRRFAEGRTDVLICTTIVESGLDITRANTILVDRADRFGIAELYQLRGRVGRGARQGYAYFLLPEEGLVDAEARERLDALRKHSGHGSGYNLSLRDLEIRGAGNLLGSEQSGHIAAVGFSLYCQLLQRTIAKMKGEAVPDIIEVSVNLDFIDFSPGTADPDSGASLPYDYVEEEAQRMDFHRRLAEAATVKDVMRLRRELADRYGRLPPAAVRLVKLAEFRVRCAAKRVARIDVKGDRAVFYLRGSHNPSFVERVQGTTADRKISSLFQTIENV